MRKGSTVRTGSAVGASAIALWVGAAWAAPPVLRVPPPAQIPRTEPAPSGPTLSPAAVAAAAPPSTPTPDEGTAEQHKPQKKLLRVRVTLFPLSHPGVSEDTAVAVQRALSDELRKNTHLDMKDLDQRLSDFAQDVPFDQVDLARNTYQKGREALQRLDLDAAAVQLEDAVDQLVAVLPHIKKQELADAMMSLAVAHHQKGNRRATNAALIRLLTWRADYQLDTSEFPEQMQGPLEDARRAVSKLARGEVRITTEPAGAQVFLDGRYIGVTPVTAPDQLVGEHYLTFKKIGYKKALRVAAVSSRTPVSVSAKLAQSEKYLLVKQALDRVERGLGAPRLDLSVDNLKETMYLDHGVFLRLTPLPGGAEGAVQVAAYLYDLRTRELLKEQRAPLASSAMYESRLAQVGQGLYAGVDYEGALKPPPEPPPPPKVVYTPVYKRWWFITTAALVVAGGAAALGAGLVLTRTPTCPDGHACTGPFIY